MIKQQFLSRNFHFFEKIHRRWSLIIESCQISKLEDNYNIYLKLYLSNNHLTSKDSVFHYIRFEWKCALSQRLITARTTNNRTSATFSTSGNDNWISISTVVKRIFYHKTERIWILSTLTIFVNIPRLKIYSRTNLRIIAGVNYKMLSLYAAIH